MYRDSSKSGRILMELVYFVKTCNNIYLILYIFISGACHAEELQYLFPIAKELFVSASPTENDLKLRDIMTSLWVNFAKTR